MNSILKNKILFYFTIVLILICLFYSHTLGYSIKLYDESTVFKEDYLPICLSLSELFELISLLGLNNCFEAGNTIYSNILSMRCNPVGNFLQLLLQFLLQRNPFHYHLYALILHIITSSLLFFSINKISSLFPNLKKNTSLFLSSTLTILWATHPVNVESVLLLTNANIVLGHTLCALVFFLSLSFFLNPKSFSFFSFNSFIIFILFSVSLFTAEFNFILPFILLSLFFGISSFCPMTSSLYRAFVITLPLFLASFLFVLFFFLSPTYTNISSSPLSLLPERIFWLSPQILFHFLKLLFFPFPPNHLSIDQSFFIYFSHSLFSLYAIFCFLLILSLLLFSFFSFSSLSQKKTFPTFFLSFIPLLTSLIPYSQLLSPSYNLASERYLYFPSFILIFSISISLLYFLSKPTEQNSYTFIAKNFSFILLVILLTFSSRAYIRTLDWKDSFSLYKSTIDATNNPLHKAFRYKTLIPQDKIFSQFPEDEVPLKYKRLALKYSKLAISHYSKEVQLFQHSTPQILKFYGLDPQALLAKSAYLYSQAHFHLYNNPSSSLHIITNLVPNPSLLPIDALSFLASLYFHNNELDKAYDISMLGLKKDPYSLKFIFIISDLIQIKSGDLNKIEEYSKKAFKYFPYNPQAILLSLKLYEAKKDLTNYAYFSYLYGLRTHSIQDLQNAKNAYLVLNKKDMAERAIKNIIAIQKELSGLKHNK